MGKRSNFKRNPKDYYVTPYEAVKPLLAHLPPGTRYVEPCVGNGALVRHLSPHGHVCTFGSDIEDRGASQAVYGVATTIRFPVMDALTLTDAACAGADYIITNPPWTRTKKNPILHKMIEHFSLMKPTWLLFDADWMHTIQAAPYLVYCQHIVSIGRVKWIPGSKNTGKDNACWYHFDQNYEGPPATEFFGR